MLYEKKVKEMHRWVHAGVKENSENLFCPQLQLWFTTGIWHWGQISLSEEHRSYHPMKIHVNSVSI